MTSVFEIVKQVQPSLRGGLEITAVSNVYLKMGWLNVVKLSPAFTRLDAGTEDSLLESAITIHRRKKRNRSKCGLH